MKQLLSSGLLALTLLLGGQAMADEACKCQPKDDATHCECKKTCKCSHGSTCKHCKEHEKK